MNRKIAVLGNRVWVKTEKSKRVRMKCWNACVYFNRYRGKKRHPELKNKNRIILKGKKNKQKTKMNNKQTNDVAKLWEHLFQDKRIRDFFCQNEWKVHLTYHEHVSKFHNRRFCRFKNKHRTHLRLVVCPSVHPFSIGCLIRPHSPIHLSIHNQSCV